MTEEELQQILEEYGDISFYIKDQVFDYKKETTKFMDGIKMIFFAYLIDKVSNINFKDKINEELNKLNKQLNKQSNKAYKTVSDLTKYLNEGTYTKDTLKPRENALNELLEQLKLDTKSTKTANDKYVRILVRYYDKFSETLKKEPIQMGAYLSSKVDKFDKIEKTVAYNNPNAKNGKAYYDIATYNSMVYNTNLARTGWIETIKDAQKRGYDIVFVEPHMYSCPMCQEYQGKFYSLTGSSFIYPDIQNAFEGGLLHPNCTHQIREKYPDDEETDLYSGPEWEEKYNIKQKINGLQLKKSRLLTDNKIYKKLGDLEAVDKNNSKIKKLNAQIKEQKKLMS